MFKFSRPQKGDNDTELNSLKPLEKVNLVEKANLIRLAFSLSLYLFATNKLRLSAYPRTPSGNPKLTLWLSLSVLKNFSYPLKEEAVKKQKFFNSLFFYYIGNTGAGSACFYP